MAALLWNRSGQTEQFCNNFGAPSPKVTLEGKQPSVPMDTGTAQSKAPVLQSNTFPFKRNHVFNAETYLLQSLNYNCGRISRPDKVA